MTISHAVILAGGRSTRMGRDKALITLAGMTLLERVARTALAVCPRVWVVGRTAAPANWPEDVPASFLPDAGDSPGGPLVGLITALEHLQKPLLLLACDTPLLSAATLGDLIQVHSPSSAATLSTSSDSAGTLRAEPTLAIYTPALLPLLQSLLAQDRRSLQQLTSLPTIATWLVPASRQHELLNINDPATLLQAQAALQK